MRAYILALVCVPLWSQWQALGPFGGSAAFVQVDPHRTDTVLAATSNALLFRSTDGGYFWKPLAFPAQLQGTLHAFVLDPKTRDVYFAGLSSDTAAYRGMFRTRDGGATWQLLPGLKNKDVWAIAIFPADSRVIAAGTGDGVFLSRDGGDAWTRISPAENRELQPVVSLVFDPKNSHVLYAGTPHLPWKTSNAGASWRSIHTGMADDSDVFSIDVDRKQPQRVFASACSGLYSSLNGGATWRKLNGAKGASYRTYFVAEDPRNPGVVYAGTNHGLVKSDNHGATWRQLSSNSTHWVAFDPWHPWRTFVATDDAGILRSNDRGKTFQAANEGFCNRFLPGLAAAEGAVYTAANGLVFQLAGETGSWRKVGPAQQLFAIAAAAESSQQLFAAGYRTLLVSSDGGRTWSSLPAPAPGSRINALLVVSGQILAGTEAGLFRSDNAGKSWVKTDLGPVVRSLVKLGPGNLAAIAGSGLFLSKDGVSWKAAGVVSSNTEILGVAASGRETLFAATSRGLMRSDDLGGSWQRGGLDGNTVSAVCAHPRRSGVVFAAQYGIIYVSTDNGRLWKRISPEDLLLTSVRELDVLPGTPDRLFALTRSQGVFRLPLEAQASVFSTAQ